MIPTSDYSMFETIDIRAPRPTLEGVRTQIMPVRDTSIKITTFLVYIQHSLKTCQAFQSRYHPVMFDSCIITWPNRLFERPAIPLSTMVVVNIRSFSCSGLQSDYHPTHTCCHRRGTTTRSSGHAPDGWAASYSRLSRRVLDAFVHHRGLQQVCFSLEDGKKLRKFHEWRTIGMRRICIAHATQISRIVPG